MTKTDNKWTKTQNVAIRFLNWIVRNILVLKLSDFAKKNFIFFTPAGPWKKGTLYNVIINMMSCMMS